MPILKTLIEIEDAGYIPFHAAPINPDREDDLISELLTRLAFVASCGLLASPSDSMLIVVAVKPFPISNTDIRRAIAAAQAELRPLLPPGAMCEPVSPIALRTFPYICQQDTPVSRSSNLADRPLQWHTERQ